MKKLLLCVMTSFVIQITASLHDKVSPGKINYHYNQHKFKKQWRKEDSNAFRRDDRARKFTLARRGIGALNLVLVAVLKNVQEGELLTHDQLDLLNDLEKRINEWLLEDLEKEELEELIKYNQYLAQLRTRDANLRLRLLGTLKYQITPL